MHLQNGQYEGGVMLELPNTAFLGNKADLMLAYRHIIGALPHNARLRFSLETGPVQPDFLAAYKARLTATEPALRHLIEKTDRAV